MRPKCRLDRAILQERSDGLGFRMQPVAIICKLPPHRRCKTLNFDLLRRTQAAATHALAEQGQVTDRYIRAVEQLSSDKVDVRTGGI